MGYTLSGKIALVTGANRGIGEAIVDALVSAGVKKVYATARTLSTLDSLVARHGSRVVPLRLDVTNAEQIPAAARQSPTPRRHRRTARSARERSLSRPSPPPRSTTRGDVL